MALVLALALAAAVAVAVAVASQMMTRTVIATNFYIKDQDIMFALLVVVLYCTLRTRRYCNLTIQYVERKNL